jgi:hypothetical protein
MKYTLICGYQICGKLSLFSFSPSANDLYTESSIPRNVCSRHQKLNILMSSQKQALNFDWRLKNLRGGSYFLIFITEGRLADFLQPDDNLA